MRIDHTQEVLRATPGRQQAHLRTLPLVSSQTLYESPFWATDPARSPQTPRALPEQFLILVIRTPQRHQSRPGLGPGPIHTNHTEHFTRGLLPGGEPTDPVQGRGEPGSLCCPSSGPGCGSISTTGGNEDTSQTSIRSVAASFSTRGRAELKVRNGQRRRG